MLLRRYSSGVPYALEQLHANSSDCRNDADPAPWLWGRDHWIHRQAPMAKRATGLRLQLGSGTCSVSISENGVQPTVLARSVHSGSAARPGRTSALRALQRQRRGGAKQLQSLDDRGEGASVIWCASPLMRCEPTLISACSSAGT